MTIAWSVALLAAICAPLPGAVIENVHVQHVVNGEVVLVQASMGGQDVQLPVRLLYLQTAESVMGTEVPGIKEAKAILEKWIDTTSTYVLWAPTKDFVYDEGGRMLAVLYRDDVWRSTETQVSVQEHVLAAGVRCITERHWPLTEDHALKRQLPEVENASRRAHFGLWRDPPAWLQAEASKRAAKPPAAP